MHRPTDGRVMGTRAADTALTGQDLTMESVSGATGAAVDQDGERVCSRCRRRCSLRTQ